MTLCGCPAGREVPGGEKVCKNCLRVARSEGLEMPPPVTPMGVWRAEKTELLGRIEQLQMANKAHVVARGVDAARIEGLHGEIERLTQEMAGVRERNRSLLATVKDLRAKSGGGK